MCPFLFLGRFQIDKTLNSFNIAKELLDDHRGHVLWPLKFLEEHEYKLRVQIGMAFKCYSVYFFLILFFFSVMYYFAHAVIRRQGLAYIRDAMPGNMLTLWMYFMTTSSFWGKLLLHICSMSYERE